MNKHILGLSLLLMAGAVTGAFCVDRVVLCEEYYQED